MAAVLVGFRPDTQLASVFGVTSTGNTLQEEWVASTRQPRTELGWTSVMKFHGTADVYTLTTGTALATFYQTPTSATTSPAVVTKSVWKRQAVLFAYDLSATVALIRQGNPAWAGYPNNHDGNITMRASQMFMDRPSGQFWNDLGDGTLNDVPQADEQMRLFSNAVVLTNAAKLPLPRFWYFPNQQRGLLLFTGDHHGDPESNSITKSYGTLLRWALQRIMWNRLTTSSVTPPRTTFSRQAIPWHPFRRHCGSGCERHGRVERDVERNAIGHEYPLVGYGWLSHAHLRR